MILGTLFGGWEIILILAALFLLPISLGLTAFWIWMLVDCIKNTAMSSNEKVGWILAIVFTHWLGALIYFCAGRNRPVAGTPLNQFPPSYR